MTQSEAEKFTAPEFIQKLKERDENALAEFAEFLMSFVDKYIQSHYGDIGVEDREDLALNASFLVIKNLDNLLSKAATLYPYIKVLAENLAREHQRKRLYSVERDGIYVDEASLQRGGLEERETEQAVEEQERYKLLSQEILSVLPEKDAKLLTFYLQGFNTHEIAEELQITDREARVRLSRITNQLRQRLTP